MLLEVPIRLPCPYRKSDINSVARVQCNAGVLEDGLGPGRGWFVAEPVAQNLTLLSDIVVCTKFSTSDNVKSPHLKDSHCDIVIDKSAYSVIRMTPTSFRAVYYF